jgi:hypothetical protein
MKFPLNVSSEYTPLQYSDISLAYMSQRGFECTDNTVTRKFKLP